MRSGSSSIDSNSESYGSPVSSPIGSGASSAAADTYGTPASSPINSVVLESGPASASSESYGSPDLENILASESPVGANPESYGSPASDPISSPESYGSPASDPVSIPALSESEPSIYKENQEPELSSYQGRQDGTVANSVDVRSNFNGEESTIFIDIASPLDTYGGGSSGDNLDVGDIDLRSQNNFVEPESTYTSDQVHCASSGYTQFV